MSTAAERRTEKAFHKALETVLAVALHEAADPDCTGNPSYEATAAKAAEAAHSPLMVRVIAEWAQAIRSAAKEASARGPLA